MCPFLLWMVYCGIYDMCIVGFVRLVYSYSSKTKTHYSHVSISAMASQITGVSIALSTVFSGAYQRNHQSSASLAFVRGIYTWPAGSPHKRPVTRKIFPFDDVIMKHFSRCYAYICTGNARSQDISNNFIGLVCPKYFNLNIRRVEQTEGKNSQHSAQNIFKYIFLKENHHIFIKISMKFLTVTLT